MTTDSNITIRRIGSTGRAFAITSPYGTDVRVRSASQRRFVVVDLITGRVDKRSDRVDVVKAQARKWNLAGYHVAVIDTVGGSVWSDGAGRWIAAA